MTQQVSTRAPAIALESIHLKLTSLAGEVNILRGIDLNIDAGETVGIVGPSGSGKTSLLMVIAGLERPTSGIVRVSATTLNGLDEDELARFRRDHVGIVFQDFHLVPTMTALENVAMPLEFAGIADSLSRARAGLTSVGLDHRLDHYPGQLSGGEQQRVAIARAFAPDPSILLADEPTGNLDGETGRTIMDTLFALHEKSNTTLVLITHEPQVVKRCSRVISIADGGIEEDNQGHLRATGLSS